MTLITPTHVQCWGHGRLCLINVSVPVQELRSTSTGSEVFGGGLLQQPRKRRCFFSSLSAGSDEAARWQRGFQGVSNRRAEEQAVNSFLESKVSGECFIWWIVGARVKEKMILDVGRDAEEASRRVANDKHPIDIACLQLCSHLLHAQSPVRGRWPEPSTSVFNLMLKDTARLWSGLTKYHFPDLDIQIVNVTVLFCWHAVVHTDATMEAHSEEHGDGVKVWNSLMLLGNKVDLNLNINATYRNVLLWFRWHRDSDFNSNGAAFVLELALWLDLWVSRSQTMRNRTNTSVFGSNRHFHCNSLLTIFDEDSRNMVPLHHGRDTRVWIVIKVHSVRPSWLNSGFYSCG